MLRLDEPGRCMENPTFLYIYYFNRTLPSHMLVFAPLTRPLYHIITPMFFPSLLAATQRQQHSFVTATGGASVCTCTCVLLCMECMLSSAHKTFKKSFFLACESSRSAYEPQQQHTSFQQQRYNGSRAPSPHLWASSHGVCACGWCTAAGNQTQRPMQ